VYSPAPSINDWYETVKLNYGFDFTQPDAPRLHPSAVAPAVPVPDTWLKMDAVLAHWQEAFGVDGFRCDMAHMIPPEFWHWALPRARGRDPATIFIAEAYNNDPAKVPSSDPLMNALNGRQGHVMIDLLAAGFTAVYDDPTYKTIKHLYDGGGWANDLDRLEPPDFVFRNALRYLENHDEVRLAAPGNWGNIGPSVGPACAAVLYALSGGPVLVYHGQEVGERGADHAGFATANGRTSIFDYWGLEELQKWVQSGAFDGAGLSQEQKRLREQYTTLLRQSGDPIFRFGEFIPLNPLNIPRPQAGRADGESASGHWVYAFARVDRTRGAAVYAVVNLSPHHTFHDISIQLPDSAQLSACGLVDLLGNLPASTLEPDGTIAIPVLPPLTGCWYETLG
jgi:glycosidase